MPSHASPSLSASESGPGHDAPLAPELRVSDWFNTRNPLTLADLRGKVVVLHAFQMLCPGCVSHGIPQAERIRRTFSESDVAVIGLHTVFEHHAVMTPAALRVFLHEYRVGIPVGVDLPAPGAAVPQTMAAYGMRGTPSLVLIDRAGRIRAHHFGQADDMAVAAGIAELVHERLPAVQAQREAAAAPSIGASVAGAADTAQNRGGGAATGNAADCDAGQCALTAPAHA